MPYVARTSGRRPAGNATPPLKIQGEGWFASEWHLEAWWQLHAARYGCHFFFLSFIDTTCSIVERRSDQIFQHVFIVFQQAWIDFNATHVVRTVDGDFHQASA